MEVAGGGSPRDDVPLLPLIVEDSGDRMAAATWLVLASAEGALFVAFCFTIIAAGEFAPFCTH
eukprot:scaffold37820_cov179-Skeletonema_marinoi.AAC.4